MILTGKRKGVVFHIANTKIDASLDITCDVCPITFAKTLVKLEDMEEGEVLEVILNDGKPAENVPKSIGKEGHKILLKEKIGDKYRLLIERGSD